PVPHRPSVVLLRRSPLSSLFPYTTLFRSLAILDRDYAGIYAIHVAENYRGLHIGRSICLALLNAAAEQGAFSAYLQVVKGNLPADRKSTRLNSSHVSISYAVFCLKKTTE